LDSAARTAALQLLRVRAWGIYIGVDEAPPPFFAHLFPQMYINKPGVKFGVRYDLEFSSQGKSNWKGAPDQGKNFGLFNGELNVSKYDGNKPEGMEHKQVASLSLIGYAAWHVGVVPMGFAFSAGGSGTAKPTTYVNFPLGDIFSMFNFAGLNCVWFTLGATALARVIEKFEKGPDET
jgi:hypothetical protein